MTLKVQIESNLKSIYLGKKVMDFIVKDVIIDNIPHYGLAVFLLDRVKDWPHSVTGKSCPKGLSFHCFCLYHELPKAVEVEVCPAPRERSMELRTGWLS